MTWTDADRHYFLGSRESFEKRYCRDDNQGQTLAADRIVQGYLSRLIFKLTCVLPNLYHRTPNWNSGPNGSHPQRPIIALGSVLGDNLKRRNRCGLCEVDGRIYFWIDEDNAVCAPATTPGWVRWWAGATGRDRQYRYDQPISPDIVPDVALLAVMGQLNMQHGGLPFTAREVAELWQREPSDLPPLHPHAPRDSDLKVPRLTIPAEKA